MAELAPLASVLAGELQSQIESDVSKEDPVGSLEPENRFGALADDPDYQNLWKALEFDPLSIDELVRISGLPVASVSSMLLMLELRGLVETHSSGRYSRTA